MWCEDLVWVQLNQDIVWCLAFVNTIMKPQLQYMTENSFIN